MLHVRRSLLAALCLHGPFLLAAQQGLWQYDQPAPLPGLAGTRVAGNGDLLLSGMRIAPGGDVLWNRSHTVDGTSLPLQLGHATEQGGEVVFLGTYFAGSELALALVFADGQGQATGGLRIVDPTAPYGFMAPWEQVVPAPDGGLLVLKEGVYHLNADRTLRWARRYASDQRPRSVAWAADGGFYGVSEGAGVLRYGPDGQVLRVLSTLGDRYDGILAVTVKHAPVLHDHKLYLGISTTFLEGGFLRTNAGVMVMDTMGAVLGHLMNGELLSPPGQNSAGAHVALAVQGQRVLVGMVLALSPSGTQAYLLDHDLGLADARWHAVEATGDTHVNAAIPHDGMVVMGGAFGGKTMAARLVAGTSFHACFAPRPYTPAPLEIMAHSGIPAAAPPVPATVQAIAVNSSALPLPSVTRLCQLAGIAEQEAHSFRVYPNPASSHVVVDWPRWEPGSLLRIQDAAGRCVAETMPSGPVHTLDMGDSAAGPYQLHVLTPGGTRITKALHVLR